MPRSLATLALCVALLVPVAASAEFGMGISFGGYTGDRLYSAESSVPRIWRSPVGQASGTGDELLVDLESWAQFGLTGFAPLSPRLGLRFDLAFTDVDVDGKVRDQTGASETVSWDQLFILDFIAQATWRLGRSDDSYPYLALGPSLSVASAEGSTLDQTMPGIAYGAGWRISAAKASYLEIYVRGQVQWPNFDDEKSRLEANGNTVVTTEDTINAFAAGVSFGYLF